MNDGRLWIETNVAWSPHKVRELADVARPKGVRLVVHAQVHLEICRQRRERDGERFSQDLIETFLDQLGVEVVEAKLDRAAAERWAEVLHRRYPSKKAWKRAKLSAVRATLPDEAAVPAERVPMTTDWLIALAVEDDGAFVAVEDKREEWGALRAMVPRRALTFEEALAWLHGLPDAG